VAQWVNYLLTEKLWGPDDRVFPATQIALGEALQFEACGLARTHWSNAGPIRAIFREAFVRAGIPYANPRSFRATLPGLGEKLCKTPEEFRARSQNMGHEGVPTTFTSYGEVSRERQARIIRSLGTNEEDGNNPAVQKLLEAALAAARPSRAFKHEIHQGHPQRDSRRRPGHSSLPHEIAADPLQQWRRRWLAARGHCAAARRCAGLRAAAPAR
jgi:hypothetical protein